MSKNLYSTKEGSSLVFMRNISGKDKTLKYDFKDGEFYTANRKFNWRKLKGLGSVTSFFRGLTSRDVRDSFDSPHYRDFLDIVIEGAPNTLTNIGSMLQYIPRFQHMESWVLQDGLKFSKPSLSMHSRRDSYYRRNYPNGRFNGIKKPVNIYQKEVLMFMKEISAHNTRMKEIYNDPDNFGSENRYKHKVEFDLTWESNYESTHDTTLPNGSIHTTTYESMFIKLCTLVRSKYKDDWEIYEWVYDLLMNANRLEDFIDLVVIHNLEYKALFNYMVEIDHREALAPSGSITMLNDYLNMSKELGNTRANKYPRFLKLRHDITTRNYKIKPEATPENAFQKHIIYGLDWMDKTHAVVSPITPQEMVEEGNKLHHCVAQYIKKVVNGVCQIMFLRDLEDGNQPLMTLEVKNLAITQVRGDENRDPSPEEIEILLKFAKAKLLHYEQGGYDATEDRKLDLKKREAKARQEAKEAEEKKHDDNKNSDQSQSQEVSETYEGSAIGSTQIDENGGSFSTEIQGGFCPTQNYGSQVPAPLQCQVGV